MARKRSGNKFYFTQETEQAIIDFNASDDPIKRNRIYNEHIRAAFEKLVESLYHTFKFYYIDMPVEDIKHEAIALLNEKITNNNPPIASFDNIRTEYKFRRSHFFKD